MISKQTDPQSAIANRHPPAPPTTRRGGGTHQASKSGRAGERGQGEGERMMKGHGEHEYLIISSPALLTSSKHRITHQPAAPSKENARRPVAIPSPSRRHHIMGQAAATAISHRSRSRPRRHLITSKAWPRQRRSHDITRQASSPVGSPSLRHGKRGEERDDEGRAGKGEARTTGDIAEREASSQPRPMTSPTASPEQTQHEQRGNRAE